MWIFSDAITGWDVLEIRKRSCQWNPAVRVVTAFIMCLQNATKVGMRFSRIVFFSSWSPRHTPTLCRPVMTLAVFSLMTSTKLSTAICWVSTLSLEKMSTQTLLVIGFIGFIYLSDALARLHSNNHRSRINWEYFRQTQRIAQTLPESKMRKLRNEFSKGFNWKLRQNLPS